MDAHIVRWLVFLLLITKFSATDTSTPFTLSPAVLKAAEGSCAQMDCQVTGSVNDDGAHWFWMKDAKWNESAKDFDATIAYSSNESKRPVSSGFGGRVKYIGSPSLSWEYYSVSPEPLCGILICDLKRNDSGEYNFRFAGKTELERWRVTKVTLTVEENQCPLTFQEPLAVNNSGRITLTCSTLPSCPSTIHIEPRTTPPLPQLPAPNPNAKSITLSFDVSWEDNGKVFSCKTHDNTDKYLIRNISVTVEYVPKDVAIVTVPQQVKEGDAVTFTCSAKANPAPTFSWFKDDQSQFSGAEWKIASITATQSGTYYCLAQNKHGETSSEKVVIDIMYPPVVVIQTSPGASDLHGITLKHNQSLTMTCKVKRSNPQQHSYAWYKDGGQIGLKETYAKSNIQPEDSGSYTCAATNTVGTGQSQTLQIEVQYPPTNTRVSCDSSCPAKLGKPLKLTCDTAANPVPSYTWYKNTQLNTVTERDLYFERVQRTDEACYRCSAHNDIGRGDSPPMCIKVLFPPSKPTLSMETEVTEGQTVTITCTVDSFPPSTLRLMTTFATKPFRQFPGNTFQHRFNVTSEHAGSYWCTARNSEGSNESTRKTLAVKHAPKRVKVQAQPGFVVKENTSLTLTCAFQSNPREASVTWMKMTDGEDKTIQRDPNVTFIIPSASPSDSGQYSCTVTNHIGTGKSPRAELKVQYAPKRADVTQVAEKQGRDGTRSVTVSCSSRCYPPVSRYAWYKKAEGQGKDQRVSEHQNYTVSSNEPGYYYCVAANDISQKASDLFPLFIYDYMRILKILLICLGILLLILLIVFIRRYRKKKSFQRETTDREGRASWFLAATHGRCDGNRREDPVYDLAGPCRDTDDPLLHQSCRPEGQQHQRHPDDTHVSYICPANVKAFSSQTPGGQHGGQTVADSVNYASLHFWKKNKKKATANVDVVYAVVSKPKHAEKNEQETLEYENVSAAHAPKPARVTDSDTSDSDTSDSDTGEGEGEVELNYTQVSFAPKPRSEAFDTDSSTSSEDEIQYSDVKL